ncbi:MAG: NrfD/PsrC family molybdoenzyme membrane anchor subunit [Thermodesulfobacteriota bacterium]|nr:polysulfide reductase NrfD [Desulfovibrionales bacterium]MDQ7836946.1 NrfD/PsrC family molybdoenzyme membrane anchor subunit [Thermodesulfobacteriota bacterium]
MLEKALYGSKGYYVWILLLLGLIGLGSIAYYTQLTQGLKITGMSRDVSWGFYIAQFTYLVGVAASAVMLVLPYYFHHYKAFSKMIILGEFMAISAVSMCMLFIVVDLGQPQRLLNVILHPTPNSILFWDMVVLNGYLFLNIIIGWTTLQAERKGVTPASWIKPLVYLSVIWAFSIHTVTAFLYAGIPGRHYWLTAIMAARFLASAFCSGPAILLLLSLLLRRLTKYDPGKEAIQSLAKIITYAMCVNVFFFGLELFTAFYSNIPGHMHSFEYLFYGLEGHNLLVPFMWAAVVMAFGSLVLLIPPAFRNNENILIPALLMLVGASWIDKGLALLVAGFVPNMFERVTEYAPTIPELAVSMMVYATGALILTVLWKVAVSVKKEIA